MRIKSKKQSFPNQLSTTSVDVEKATTAKLGNALAMDQTVAFDAPVGFDDPAEDDFDEDSYDGRLAIFLAQITDRMQAGEILTLHQACQEKPEFADDLRELLGTMFVADAIGGSDKQSDDEADEGIWQLKLPIRMGDYELLEEIGRGGMGVVFRATQVSLGREVAIKMIQRERIASQDERKRFFVEAESTARLSHPNIVPVYEVGELGGRPYFSMACIHGQTLMQRIGNSPMPQRQAVQVIAPICRAIAYAHMQGIVHRDIKPSNILLDEEGQPKLTDFGLAKLTNGKQEHLTRTGAILGTPTYMSPEQASGIEQNVGPSSDIFSVGSVLYHALTGRPPLVANSPIELAMKIIEQDPPPPRLLEPRLDRDLEMIVIRCLQKPPDLRYKTADDLAMDLEAFLRDEPIAARSGRISQVVARIFRETHHAPILENWGLLWILHSFALVIACGLTQWLRHEGITNRFAYASLWTIGLGAWAAVFWMMRRRMGPVTFVERQIAHVWGASMVAIALLFPMEWWLGLKTLSLSPILGVITAMIFIIKAGILSGAFYVQAAMLLFASVLMAIFPSVAHVIFGVFSGLAFFIPGLKYYRQKHNQLV